MIVAVHVTVMLFQKAAENPQPCLTRTNVTQRGVSRHEVQKKTGNVIRLGYTFEI